MLLALNGRDTTIVRHAKSWLDYVLSQDDILNVGLLLLGDESCNNDWLNFYFANPKLRVVFMIYDSFLIDNKRIFAWPLGVAS